MSGQIKNHFGPGVNAVASDINAPTVKLGEIPYKRQSDTEAATRSFKGAVALCEHVDASRARSTSNDRGPGTRLVLAEHTGFAWDEVCILGPYTPDDTVDSLTGLQGAARQAHDIRSSDSINVLMFISTATIAASIAHLRNQGDFGPEVAGTCYSRDRANFSVRVPPADSRGNIGPE